MAHYNKRIVSLLYLFCLLLFSASCSKEELVEMKVDEPFSATLHPVFKWEDGAPKPDSMLVVAIRGINTWTTAGVVSTENMGGNYVYNPPSASWKSNTDSAIVSGNMLVRPGTYRVLAYSKQSSNAIELVDNMLGQNKNVPYYDVIARYKPYHKRAPGLNLLIDSWADYNDYSDYIQPDVEPLYMDSIVQVTVDKDQKTEVVLTPHYVFQDINFSFYIDKLPASCRYVVDSVYAEVSGIPASVDIRSMALDVTKTYKVFFPVKMLTSEGKSEDTYENAEIKLNGSIRATGIIAANSKDIKVGPGIMQVIVFLKAEDNYGNFHHRAVQGVINLYNSIQNANTYYINPENGIVTQSGKSVDITINEHLQVDGNKIIVNSVENKGIDIWGTRDDSEAEVDI